MAKSLEVVSLDYTDTQTVINWNSFDETSNQTQPEIGAWTVNGKLTKEDAIAYAKTMVGADVSVS